MSGRIVLVVPFLSSCGAIKCDRRKHGRIIRPKTRTQTRQTRTHIHTLSMFTHAAEHKYIYECLHTATGGESTKRVQRINVRGKREKHSAICAMYALICTDCRALERTVCLCQRIRNVYTAVHCAHIEHTHTQTRRYNVNNTVEL